MEKNKFHSITDILNGVYSVDKLYGRTFSHDGVNIEISGRTWKGDSICSLSYRCSYRYGSEESRMSIERVRIIVSEDDSPLMVIERILQDAKTRLGIRSDSHAMA